MAITISGNGIVEANLADNAVTLAKMASGTDGEILTYDASGNPVAVSVGTDGQVLTSTGAGSPPAFETAAGGDNTPSFKAKLSGTQVLAHGTIELVAFATEVFDTDTAFTNTASNYKFTVPSGEAGKYCFFFMNRIQHMTDGSKADFMIRINGSTDVEKASHAAHTQHLSGTVVCIADLNVGDYVQCYIYQNSGSDKNLYATTNFGGWKLI